MRTIILVVGGTILIATLLIFGLPYLKRNPELSPKENLIFKDAVGKKAPEFSLEDIDGKIIKLADFRGKFAVLFFNEGAMCYPACWNQMIAFGNDEKFNTNDVAVFSIVIDQKSEWEKIISQVPKLSKAKILFDSDRKVSAAYDVLALASSMHPPSPMHPGGYPGHTYFIIDKEGIIRYAFDDSEMGVRNDMLSLEMSKL